MKTVAALLAWAVMSATCTGGFVYPKKVEASEYIQQLRGHPGACGYLGRLLVQIGDMRDAGVPMDTVLQFIKETLIEARKDPDTFIKSDADVEFVMASVRKVWSRNNEPASIIAADVYRECMKKEIKI